MKPSIVKWAGDDAEQGGIVDCCIPARFVLAVKSPRPVSRHLSPIAAAQVEYPEDNRHAIGAL
jgi:hypothetical protein